MKMSDYFTLSPESTLSRNASLTDDGRTSIIMSNKKLKERIKYLGEENEFFEKIFSKLNILQKDLLHLSSRTIELLDKAGTIQQRSHTVDFKASSLALSHAEKLRKQNNYASKLKICTKYYVNLNEKLSSEIKYLKRELNHSKINVDNINTLSDDELKIMEAKIKRYENALLKFEKKYPWLKNPEFSLTSISKETDVITNLREKKEQLLKELSVYQGLKPNLKEASQQLEKIKIEFQGYSKM